MLLVTRSASIVPVKLMRTLCDDSEVFGGYVEVFQRTAKIKSDNKRATSSIVVEATEAQPACIGGCQPLQWCIQSKSDVKEFRLEACNMSKKMPHFPLGIKGLGGLRKVARPRP